MRELLLLQTDRIYRTTFNNFLAITFSTIITNHFRFHIFNFKDFWAHRLAGAATDTKFFINLDFTHSFLSPTTFSLFPVEYCQSYLKEWRFIQVLSLAFRAFGASGKVVGDELKLKFTKI